MILHILANAYEITSDQVYALRGLAMKNVRRTKGKVSLEAIADFQNEDRGKSNHAAVK